MFTPTIELVHSDARGEIYVINLPDEKELVLLHSAAGSLRGGHAHDVDEIVVMLTGSMRYHKREEAEEARMESAHVLKGGEASFNPTGLYHMGEFLEDSWLLEWKIDTNKKGWKNIDYQPYRSKVNANAAGK